jgi:hypothetical protein
MKHSDTKSQLIDILSLSGSTTVAQRCVSALERTPAVLILADMLVRTIEILSIYRLRVEMHCSVMEGGDDLVNALEQEHGEEVRIIAFRTDKEEILIFTDPELKRLIGCISLQRDNA